MTWVFLAVGALLVVAIALVAVGRATAELAAAPPRSLFDLDEAVQYVADRLSDDATAELSYDDVRRIIEAHLDYLADRGVASEGADGVPPSGPLVAEDDEGLAFVLGRIGDGEGAADDALVVEVLEVEVDYLTAIGAIGAPVPPPADPAG